MAFAIIKKTLVVSPWHSNVYIIIPRDEPFMSDSPQECATNKRIRNAFTSTNIIYFAKQIKSNLFDLSIF